MEKFHPLVLQDLLQDLLLNTKYLVNFVRNLHLIYLLKLRNLSK